MKNAIKLVAMQQLRHKANRTQVEVELPVHRSPTTTPLRLLVAECPGCSVNCRNAMICCKLVKAESNIMFAGIVDQRDGRA